MHSINTPHWSIVPQDLLLEIVEQKCTLNQVRAIALVNKHFNQAIYSDFYLSSLVDRQIIKFKNKENLIIALQKCGASVHNLVPHMLLEKSLSEEFPYVSEEFPYVKTYIKVDPLLRCCLNLRQLDLSESSFRSCSFELISQMSHLQSLNLKSRKMPIEALIKAIQNKDELVELNLAYSNADIKVLQAIKSPQSLKKLHIQNLPIENHNLMPFLANLASITDLNLRHIDITNAALAALPCPERVIRLTVQSAKITADIKNIIIARFTSLQELEIKSDNLHLQDYVDLVNLSTIDLLRCPYFTNIMGYIACSSHKKVEIFCEDNKETGQSTRRRLEF